MIRHIVALRFSASVSADEKAVLFADLAALQDVVEGALDFQVRRNISPETAVVHGFADLFWFDFTDETARDAYLAHPEHQAVGGRLTAACAGGVDGITVLDFEI
ncbi:MAG: Dabb family protein [Paracoccaceae bacterium]